MIVIRIDFPKDVYRSPPSGNASGPQLEFLRTLDQTLRTAHLRTRMWSRRCPHPRRPGKLAAKHEGRQTMARGAALMWSVAFASLAAARPGPTSPCRERRPHRHHARRPGQFAHAPARHAVGDRPLGRPAARHRDRRGAGQRRRPADGGRRHARRALRPRHRRDQGGRDRAGALARRSRLGRRPARRPAPDRAAGAGGQGRHHRPPDVPGGRSPSSPTGSRARSRCCASGRGGSRPSARSTSATPRRGRAASWCCRTARRRWSRATATTWSACCTSTARR